MQDNTDSLLNSNAFVNVFDACAEDMVDSKSGTEEWIKEIVLKIQKEVEYLEESR